MAQGYRFSQFTVYLKRPTLYSISLPPDTPVIKPCSYTIYSLNVHSAFDMIHSELCESKLTISSWRLCIVLQPQGHRVAHAI